MKKLVKLLSIVLLITVLSAICLTGCGGNHSSANGSNGGNQSSKSGSSGNKTPSTSGSNAGKTEDSSTISADELAAAFRAAGYLVEREYMSLEEVEEWFGIEGSTLKTYAFYEFGREGVELENDILTDYGCAYFFEFVHENNAIELYDMALYEVDEYQFEESVGRNRAKAVYNAKFGDQSEYGETYIISRVRNIVIVVVVDWDDYQDAEMVYDYMPSKVLEDLGY